MANTVLSLFAALAIFIILTEKLTINLIFGEDYIIEFHFIVFALVIKNSASSEKRRKKDDNERKSRFLKRYHLILSFMRRSDVRINTLSIYVPKSYPMSDALSYGAYSALISSFLTFAENNSRFFEVSNITLSYSEHNTVKKQLEAELKLSLIDAIISYTSFMFSKLRLKLLLQKDKKKWLKTK